MLSSKLSVFGRGAFMQQLVKLPKCLMSKQCADNKGKLCPKSQIATSVGAESRSEKYQESLGKCSRTDQRKSDCKSGGAQHEEACGRRHAAEVFSRALAKVRNEALTLQIFTRNSVNAIISSIDLENASRVKAERNRAIQRLQTVVDKIDEITKMSFVCGADKRKQCYAIHEQIFASLQIWECENVSGEQSVRRRLEELECQVKERTDTAVAIIRTCKGCVNPDSLMICVDASACDADCIIRMTSQHARSEIAAVEQLKGQILQENSHVMQQLMSEFEQAVVDFEKGLVTCIELLRKCNKK